MRNINLAWAIRCRRKGERAFLIGRYFCLIPFPPPQALGCPKMFLLTRAVAVASIKEHLNWGASSYKPVHVRIKIEEV